MDAELPTIREVSDADVDSEANRLAVAASAAIERAMEAADLKRADVADILGLARSRVTRVLDGDANLTLKSLAQLGLACGVRWQFVAVDENDPWVVVTAPDSLVEAMRTPYIAPQPASVRPEECVSSSPLRAATNYSLAA